MRRDGTIQERFASFRVGAEATLLALVCSAACVASAFAEGVGADSTAAAETTGIWLPPPVEEVESPERLTEPPLDGTLAIRADVSGGRVGTAQLAATARWRSFGATASRIEGRDGGSRQTVLLTGVGGRIRLGAGRVSVRETPVLLGEAAGFSRKLRRPLEPRSSAPTWEAPRAAASPGLDGATLALTTARGPSERAPAWSLWAAGGRGADDGEPLFAAGVAHGGARWGASAGVARRCGSGTARWRGRSSAVAFEALLSPERGPALLAAATAGTAASPLRIGARWRRRAGERRPVAAEFTAEFVATRTGLARVTWRPWSASGSTFADDGAVEVDARWRAPTAPAAARVRVGRRGGEATAAAIAFARAGASAGASVAAAVPERYVVLDLPVAGERGRLLSLLASRRERGGAGARAIGTTAGARARVAWGARAGVTAQVEAARIRGRAAGGGAAWSSAPTPSGEETLTPRGSGGVYVTVSGWVRLGGVALRVHAQDGEGEQAGGPLRATIWMEWGGSAKRSSAPGEAAGGG